MVFTVKDFSDLLRLLEINLEWRRKLRRALFPEIDVPRALQDLAEAQRRTEAAIERLPVRIESGFAEAGTERQRITERVEAGFAEAGAERQRGFAEAGAERQRGFAEAGAERQRITERVEAGFAEAAAERQRGFAEAATERQRLAERVESGFAEAAAERQRGFAEAAAERQRGFAEAAADRKEIKRDVGTLKGLAHEQFYRERAEALFGRYLTRGRDATNWVADQLQSAQQAGEVSEEEYVRVLAADLLWSGKLRDTKEQVIVVLEASWLVETNDVKRAVDRAAILRRLGLKTVPVVAGREWAEGVPEMAQEMGVVLASNGRVDQASWQAALKSEV